MAGSGCGGGRFREVELSSLSWTLLQQRGPRGAPKSPSGSDAGRWEKIKWLLQLMSYSDVKSVKMGWFISPSRKSSTWSTLIDKCGSISGASWPVKVTWQQQYGGWVKGSCRRKKKTHVRLVVTANNCSCRQLASLSQASICLIELNQS